MGYSAENLGRWVAERTDIHVSLIVGFLRRGSCEYETKDETPPPPLKERMYSDLVLPYFKINYSLNFSQFLQS